MSTTETKTHCGLHCMPLAFKKTKKYLGLLI